LNEVVRLLGAERQAATSFALAYPERRFEFVSDAAVVDGHDLANVTIVRAAPGGTDPRAGDICLCPRWSRPGFALSEIMPILGCALPGLLVPVSRATPTAGRWIAKGDGRHRPDAPVSGDAAALARLAAFDGGTVFQPLHAARGSFLATGRRDGKGLLALAVVRLHAERFFRDDVVQAAETVDWPEVAEASARALDALDDRGMFSMNWIDAGGEAKLTSFRPVPRAVAGLLRRSGLSLLDRPERLIVAAAGLRSIGRVNYSSYSAVDA
jgi:hypothetical protein